MSAENDQPAGPSMSRRTLICRTGTAAAGAAAVGVGAHRAGYSPVGDAEAIGPVVAAGAGIAVGAGVVYLAGSNSGSGVDEEEVNNALQAEDHLEIYNRAKEAYEVREENVLSSMQTEASLLRNVARENAVFAIFETAASGLSRSEAETAAIDEVDAVYRTPQERLITRINAHLEGLAMKAADLGVLMIAQNESSFQSSGTGDFDTASGTYVDGASFTGSWLAQGPSGYNTQFWNDSFGSGTEVWIDEFDPADYDQDPEDYDLSTVDGRQQFIDPQQYRDIWTNLVDEHQSMITEVTTLLDNYFEGIQSGEIQMQELLAPASMIDTASDASDWQEAALLLDAMGLPKANQPAVLQFDVSDYEEIQGEVSEYEGLLAWSLAEQSDQGLPVGQEIDPADWPGNIYFATQWEDQESGEMTADVFELIEPFTISGTQDGSSELTFETRDVVEPDTSPEEAMNIFRQNRESEQTSRETSVEVIVPDDNSGFSLDFLPSFGLPTPGGVPIWVWGLGIGAGAKKLLDSR